MRFTIPDDSEALRREVRVSQAVARVRQLPTVFVANPLLAAFIAIVYWDLASRILLILLVVSMIVLWMPALLSWNRLKGAERPTYVSEAAERKAIVMSAIAGGIWAFATAALFPVGGAAEQSALAMLLAGLCAGSVALFTSSPLASMAFYLPFMLTLLVQAITFAPGNPPVLPATVGAFIVGAVIFTQNGWGQFVETVRILVERDMLLQKSKASETQLELQLSKMEDLAMMDELTQLKNRRSFFDSVEPVIAASRRRGQNVAIAILDLDDFKKLNDRYGHIAGDAVLRQVARRIEETLRQEQIVGRIGGEEFAVLLPDTAPVHALVAIERVRTAVASAPYEIPDGTLVDMTISGGIAALPDGKAINHALQNADRAMYRAKALGKNRVEVFGEVEDATIGTVVR